MTEITGLQMNVKPKVIFNIITSDGHWSFPFVMQSTCLLNSLERGATATAV